MEDVLGWEGVVEAIAEQAPNWEPGTTHGYHARSYGWTLGEVVRRVTGRSLGRFFREQIGEPLGLDFWIGLPDVVEPRCANLIPLETEGVSLVDLLPGDSLLRRVMVGPSDLFAGGYDESWNTRPLRAAEMPSSNGIGDARSIARFYAALVGAVDGVRVLRPATVAQATEVQSSGTDQVLGVEMTFGLGYLLQPTVAPGAGRAAFGHSGAGGSLGFADPEAGISFGYAMNRLKLSLTGDERTLGLVAALYESLRRG
jgi:CubicO group peptidase (beta-lactamase class C family)